MEKQKAYILYGRLPSEKVVELKISTSMKTINETASEYATVFGTIDLFVEPCYVAILPETKKQAIAKLLSALIQ